MKYAKIIFLCIQLFVWGVLTLFLSFAFIAFLYKLIFSYSEAIETGMQTIDWAYLIVYFIWTNNLIFNNS